MIGYRLPTTIPRKDKGGFIGVCPSEMFEAGDDVHAVIETNRGHSLGKVILQGPAEPDSGIPGEIGGFTIERVLRTLKRGTFRAINSIGDHVTKGTVVAVVDDFPVMAQVTGTVRGLLRDGTHVQKGLKVGDIDPRGKKGNCFTVSEKARAIGGGVLEAILNRFNE